MKIAILVATITLAATAPAGATMIFDGSTLSRDASVSLGVNGGVFGRYTFSSATTISSFSTLDALGSAANLTFRIYNSTTGASLYTSAPKAFAADASATIAAGSFKKSTSFRLLSFPVRLTQLVLLAITGTPCRSAPFRLRPKAEFPFCMVTRT